MVQLIYASRAIDGMNVEMVEQILAASRRNNLQDNITGVLCFNRSYFLQCLEGPRDAVSRTYARIVKDERHADPVLLGYHEIAERAFSSWTMGYIPELQISREITQRFANSREFRPLEMSGESALAMLKHLYSIPAPERDVA